MYVKQAFKKNHINHPLYIAQWFRGISSLQDGKPPVIPGERRLILLDPNMPKVNGIEFCELRGGSELNRIPVIGLIRQMKIETGGGLQPEVDIFSNLLHSNFVETVANTEYITGR